MNWARWTLGSSLIMGSRSRLEQLLRRETSIRESFRRSEERLYWLYLWGFSYKKSVVVTLLLPRSVQSRLITDAVGNSIRRCVDRRTRFVTLRGGQRGQRSAVARAPDGDGRDTALPVTSEANLPFFFHPSNILPHSISDIHSTSTMIRP